MPISTLVFGRCGLLAAWALLAAAALGQPEPAELLSKLTFRSIGPAGMSGRISDIDVDPKKSSIVYVATASGGVWKSIGNGVTWTPIFDDAGTGSIGDVTISAADSNIVWVGTGEANNRNSVAWGDGVYKSTDAGKAWTNMGLAETQQIARIATHPKDPNKAWVAAIGALWGPSEHRGVYMTEDGGKTWSKTLYKDENTGSSDIMIDPSNPKVLYAGMHERRRSPWSFRSGGPNGGVYKSTDGGKTWQKLATGLPKGETGKIGLTIYPKNPKILYAIIETKQATPGSKPEDDENGVYRTDDAGKTWKHMGTHSTRPFYYHEILVDPNDDTHLYSLSTRLMESKDSGKTWQAARISIHVDFHAIWINPNDSQHIWVGNDGGVAVTYDGGQSWKHMSNIPVGQFYAIAYDMAVPYHVYGGLQDNNSWGGPSVSRHRRGVGNYEWYRIGGGDGFHVQVDPTDNETVYSESQGGGITRRNKRNSENRSIRPRSPEGERYRFNWSSPILMSPHNPRTIWFGGNKLFKSVDRGDNWRVASPDLTTNDPLKQKGMEGLTRETTGAETHTTVITISESPLKAGVVWVGTDDGLVQLTQDDGHQWTNVTANITDVPRDTWVSRVEASRFKLERCYVTFDGHRTNDMKPYVLMTDDFGATWTNVTSNLPMGSVYVIREDPASEDLLYVGTEFALFVSLDRGKSWTRWKNNLPTVAVHDILIHPREREIILGTHGRSIWIAPVSALQGLKPDVLQADFALFDMPDAYQLLADPTGGYGDGEGWFYGQNPPYGARIQYYLKSDVENLKVEIVAADGSPLYTISDAPKTKGIHTVYWSFREERPGAATGAGGQRGRPPAPQVEPGTYGVRLSLGDKSTVKTLKVKVDPQLGR